MRWGKYMKRSSKILTWLLVISMMLAVCSCSKTESTKRDRDDDSDSTRSEQKVDRDNDNESEVTSETETTSVVVSENESSSINISAKEAVELAISCFDVSADDATQRMLSSLEINEYKRSDTGDGRFNGTVRILTDFDKQFLIDGAEFNAIKILSDSANRRVFDISFEMGDFTVIVKNDEDVDKLGEYYNLPVDAAYNAIYPELISVYGDPNEKEDKTADYNADIYETSYWDQGENTVVFNCCKNLWGVNGNNKLFLEIHGNNIGDHEALPKPPLADELKIVSEMLLSAIGKDFNTAKAILEDYYGKELTVNREEKTAEGLSYFCAPTNRINVGDLYFGSIRFDCKTDGTVAAIIYINSSESEKKATAYYQEYADAFTEIYGNPSVLENNDNLDPSCYLVSEYNAEKGCIMFIIYEKVYPTNWEDSHDLFFGCKQADANWLNLDKHSL